MAGHKKLENINNGKTSVERRIKCDTGDTSLA
jgi:hypothetical protein